MPCLPKTYLCFPYIPLRKPKALSPLRRLLMRNLEGLGENKVCLGWLVDALPFKQTHLRSLHPLKKLKALPSFSLQQLCYGNLRDGKEGSTLEWYESIWWKIDEQGFPCIQEIVDNGLYLLIDGSSHFVVLSAFRICPLLQERLQYRWLQNFMISSFWCNTPFDLSIWCSALFGFSIIKPPAVICFLCLDLWMFRLSCFPSRLGYSLWSWQAFGLIFSWLVGRYWLASARCRFLLNARNIQYLLSGDEKAPNTPRFCRYNRHQENRITILMLFVFRELPCVHCEVSFQLFCGSQCRIGA